VFFISFVFVAYTSILRFPPLFSYVSISWSWCWVDYELRPCMPVSDYYDIYSISSKTSKLLLAPRLIYNSPSTPPPSANFR
jgi:hypothetical protein